MKLKNLILFSVVMLVSIIVVACSNDSKKESGEEVTENDIEQFPEKEVKIIIANKAGGTMDLAARAFQAAFKEVTGEPLIVENHTGGAEVIGTEMVADADPDGYTLGILANGVMSLKPSFMEVNYEFPNDFTPILGLGDFQALFVASADLPYESLSEMAEDFKSRDESISIGAAGANNFPHVAIQLLSNMSGVEINHVSFDSANEATLALMGGSVDLAVSNVGSTYPLIENGDLKVIGIPSSDRYDIFSDFPTLTEQGLEIVAEPSFALYGPANIPEEIQMKIYDIFLEAMDSDEFKNFTENNYIQETRMNPDELTEKIKTEKMLIESIISDLKGD